MNITKALGSRVLVKVITDGVKTPDSGLVVAPTSVNPSYFKGEVTGLGEKVEVDVQVGDKVCFVKYGYEDMGDDLYLVEENSLLAIYE